MINAIFVHNSPIFVESRFFLSLHVICKKNAISLEIDFLEFNVTRADACVHVGWPTRPDTQ